MLRLLLLFWQSVAQLHCECQSLRQPIKSTTLPKLRRRTRILRFKASTRPRNLACKSSRWAMASLTSCSTKVDYQVLAGIKLLRRKPMETLARFKTLSKAVDCHESSARVQRLAPNHLQRRLCSSMAAKHRLKNIGKQARNEPMMGCSCKAQNRLTRLKITRCTSSSVRRFNQKLAANVVATAACTTRAVTKHKCSIRSACKARTMRLAASTLCATLT